MVASSDHGNETLTSSATFRFSAATSFPGLFNYKMHCKRRLTGAPFLYTTTLQFHHFSTCVAASSTRGIGFIFKLHVTFVSFRNPKQMDLLEADALLNQFLSEV